MNDYEFTLRFSLPGSKQDPGSFVDKLALAGCEDALVGIGQNGRIALEFTRSATSALEAIASALRDIRQAIPEARLVEAAPDFVGLTDMAEIAGFSRQNMRKLMISGLSSFPLAVHEGNPAVWHLAQFLQWLKEAKKLDVDDRLLEIAKTTMQVNIAKEVRELPGRELPREISALFA